MSGPKKRKPPVEPGGIGDRRETLDREALRAKHSGLLAKLKRDPFLRSPCPRCGRRSDITGVVIMDGIPMVVMENCFRCWPRHRYTERCLGNGCARCAR